MCRSVPQMAVFSSLISTSFGPGVGTGTSSSQMPLVASRLTSAFIICAIAAELTGERGADYKADGGFALAALRVAHARGRARLQVPPALGPGLRDATCAGSRQQARIEASVHGGCSLRQHLPAFFLVASRDLVQVL